MVGPRRIGDLLLEERGDEPHDDGPRRVGGAEVFEVSQHDFAQLALGCDAGVVERGAELHRRCARVLETLEDRRYRSANAMTAAAALAQPAEALERVGEGYEADAAALVQHEAAKVGIEREVLDRRGARGIRLPATAERGLAWCGIFGCHLLSEQRCRLHQLRPATLPGAHFALMLAKDRPFADVAEHLRPEVIERDRASEVGVELTVG